MKTPDNNPHIDRRLSRKLGRRVSAEDRACWRNAIVAMSSLNDDDLPAGATVRYVEGFAATIIVGPHGWLEVTMPDGSTKLIDPTPTYHSPTRAFPVRGYFPAKRYTPGEVSKLVEARDPVLLPFNEFEMITDPDLIAARAEAWRLLYGTTPESFFNIPSPV